MDKKEAEKILEEQINKYRNKPYWELIKLIDAEPITFEIGLKDNVYQVEIQAFWDERPDSDIRVMVSVDDGAWSSFKPLCSDFIKNGNNEFVGE